MLKSLKPSDAKRNCEILSFVSWHQVSNDTEIYKISTIKIPALRCELNTKYVLGNLNSL